MGSVITYNQIGLDLEPGREFYGTPKSRVEEGRFDLLRNLCRCCNRISVLTLHFLTKAKPTNGNECLSSLFFTSQCTFSCQQDPIRDRRIHYRHGGCLSKTLAQSRDTLYTSKTSKTFYYMCKKRRSMLSLLIIRWLSN